MTVTCMANSERLATPKIESAALHEAYLQPHALHLYVRLLRGGLYFRPDTQLPPDASVNVPTVPHQAYSRLQRQWGEAREQITTPLEEWGTKAAKATVAVINAQDKKTQGLLREAFNGWGITMQKGALILQRDEIAKSFARDFYTAYCGDKAEVGMEHMATQLIATFATAPEMEKDKKNFVKVEKNVLTVLEALKEWMMRFYGSEEMGVSFAACVKAQLAAFAKRFTQEKNADITSVPLHPEEVAVLETVRKFPQITDETAGITVDHTLPSEGARSGTNGHNSPYLSSLVEPTQNGQTAGIGLAPEDEEARLLQTPLSGKERAETLSEKRLTYFAVRAQLLSLLTNFRDGEKTFDVDAVASELKIGPQRLLLRLDEMHVGDKDNDSLAIDDLIRHSGFLRGLSIDFGIFSMESLQEIIAISSEIYKKLGISLPGKRDRILPADGKERLTASELKKLVFGFAQILPSGKLTNASYKLWIDDMVVLPTLGDQLYYLISKDPRLFALYNEIKTERLQKTLFEMGDIDDDTDNTRRRSGPADTESEPWGDFLIPPMPAPTGQTRNWML